MSIDQINFSFDPKEDRILMRLTQKTAQGAAEFRIWLTRRFLRLMWGGLNQVLEGEAASTAGVEPSAQGMVKQFQEEAALSQADFSTPYSPQVVATPLGEAPMLAARLQLKAATGGNKMVSIQNEHGKGITLTLTNDMIHSIRKLMVDTALKAEWDLDLELYSVTRLAAMDEPYTVN